MPVAVQPDPLYKLPRPEAIGLDLDGTLVDSAPDLAGSANLMLRDLALAEVSAEQVRGMIGDGIEALLQRCLATSLGRAPEEDEVVRARPVLLRYYRENIFDRSVIYPGVKPALARWRGAGIRLFCITNKASVLTGPLLDASGLRNFIDAFYCADLRADRKPAPNLILKCCADRGVSPDRFLMIGDSSHDVLAARAAGSPAVAVNYGYGDADALQAAAAMTMIDRLENLAFD